MKKLIEYSKRNQALYRFVKYFAVYFRSLKCIIYNGGYAKIVKDINGENNKISIGKDSILDRVLVRIHEDNNCIEIGTRVKVGRDCSIWIEGSGIRITVGDNTTMSHNSQLLAQEDGTKIIIDKDCMISHDVNIRTSDSHPIYSKVSGQRINCPCSVVIGDHVWITPNSKVMKRVSIKSGAIVGSDTIVAKDIPSNTLSVGHPAKSVKEDIQ